ncbi:WD repeat-containing protein 76-like [Eriocheir sinensis]|uniref:WD repeat-containing protein 76-like n=1 Tax=Eriocheir sinensis TaxID=95602 RepID=UPI0021C99AA9|nr:WD repeat-containing protein 76-like [Eriocheir sinensis]
MMTCLPCTKSLHNETDRGDSHAQDQGTRTTSVTSRLASSSPAGPRGSPLSEISLDPDPETQQGRKEQQAHGTIWHSSSLAVSDMVSTMSPTAMATRRSSRRVLQPRNRRMLSSSPESPPARKRMRVKEIKKKVKVEKKEESSDETYSPHERPSVRKNMQGKRIKKEVKEEEEENAHDENTSMPPVILSEFERKIQERIAERNRLMASLGILKVKEELNASVAEARKKKAVYRGIVREQKSQEPVVIRRSLRQQQLTPDGLNLTLPSDEQVARAEKRAASPVDDHSRPQPGPAPLMDFYKASNREECEAMLQDLATVSSSSSSGMVEVWGGSTDEVVNRLKQLSLVEERVVKVVPDRIFSACFHPTVEKMVVMVGGKWGGLGIWEVGREDESNGAYCFQPHARPINCMSVSPGDPCLVHTTSYDGSLRQTDLHAAQVKELYGLDDDQRNSFLCWHAQQDAHTFLLAASLGRVMQVCVCVDARCDGRLAKELLVHDWKNVKVVTAHPHHTHYYATGGSDGLVCLWDVRSHKKNKPIDSVVHGRNVTGLEFSSSGEVLVSTSHDDYLRFITCDGTALEVERKIKHNNHTGRWLTTFKARFVPSSDDLVCVGSMMWPRRVEVWGRDGSLKHELAFEALGSVNSILAFHPQQHALAGCNSSGRVYVYM